MDSFFPTHIAQGFVDRLNHLKGSTQPRWGQMNAAQMLAHCREVSKEALGEKEIIMVDLDEKTRKQLLYDNTKDYTPMAKGIEADEGSIIIGERDFETEKSKFSEIIEKLKSKKKNEFEGRLHPFFGSMTANEWYVLTYKHLDHHFRQFGI